MGNYRFRFSDMIPNAWFYKLKDMSKGRSKQSNSHSFKKKLPFVQKKRSNISQPTCTYYFTTTHPHISDKKFYNSPINPKLSDIHFPDFSPRKSSHKRSKRKTIYQPSPKLVVDDDIDEEYLYSSEYIYSTSSELEFHESLLFESEAEEEKEEDDDNNNGFAPNCSFDLQVASCSSSCNCKVSSSNTDIIIDVNSEPFKNKSKKIDGLNTISEIELPPILTKPAKFKKRSSKLQEIKPLSSLSIKKTKEERRIIKNGNQATNSLKQRCSSNSVGIKLRSANSPRIASRKIQAAARRSISSSSSSRIKSTLLDSLAVVKSSTDPQKDFRDSMVEMILENNIWSSKDLEELLACFLSLNSKEYHIFIVKAFEQIWFEMFDLRL